MDGTGARPRSRNTGYSTQQRSRCHPESASTRTSEIVKVARGTYQLVKFVDPDNAVASAQEIATETAQVKAETPGSETLTDQDFYASFTE
jgi:hypothetical protein